MLDTWYILFLFLMMGEDCVKSSGGVAPPPPPAYPTAYPPAARVLTSKRAESCLLS